MAHYYDKDTGMDLLAPYVVDAKDIEEISLNNDTKKTRLYGIGKQENNGNTFFFKFDCLNFISYVFANKYNDENELIKSKDYIIEEQNGQVSLLFATEEAYYKWKALYPDLDLRTCIVNFGVKLNKAILDELKRQNIYCNNIFDNRGVIRYDGDISSYWNEIKPVIAKCNESIIEILDEAERVATIEKEHIETEEREINEE